MRAVEKELKEAEAMLEITLREITTAPYTETIRRVRSALERVGVVRRSHTIMSMHYDTVLADLQRCYESQGLRTRHHD